MQWENILKSLTDIRLPPSRVSILYDMHALLLPVPDFELVIITDFT